MTAIPSIHRAAIANSAGCAFSPGWPVVGVMALAAGILPA